MKPLGKPIKWNSRVAYAVGLITTDGNLSPDGRHLVLVSKDIPQLETFKKCLKLKTKIHSRKSTYTGRKDCYGVQFGNVILYKWLLSIGLMANKSKRIGPLRIPNKYFFDFLRGHIDGDGNFSVFWDPVYPKSRRLYIGLCSASLNHIEWLRKRINSILDIDGFIEKREDINYLKFAKNDSLKLLPRLYYAKNIPYLKRKYNIVKEFLK